MSDEYLLQMLGERHEQVVTMLRQLDEKLTTQNGRVGRLEQTVAVLQDRSPSRAAATAGVVAGGGVSVLALFFEWLSKR
jgi:hypothetical protein